MNDEDNIASSSALQLLGAIIIVGCFTYKEQLGIIHHIEN
jgi:hypothetical protein